jgi:hypothetical protein
MSPSTSLHIFQGLLLISIIGTAVGGYFSNFYSSKIANIEKSEFNDNHGLRGCCAACVCGDVR